MGPKTKPFSLPSGRRWRRQESQELTCDLCDKMMVVAQCPGSSASRLTRLNKAVTTAGAGAGDQG